MSKGSKTRAAILGEALALTSQIGFESLSIATLARAVNVSKSSVFVHFDSKEVLQLEVLDHAAQLFRDTVVVPTTSAPRGEPRVRALLDNWLCWALLDSLPGGCIFVTASNEFQDRPGRIRDHLLALQESWLAFLAGLGALAIEAGDFRSDLDTQQFAHDLYAIALAFKHFHGLMGAPEAESRARIAFDRLLADCRPTH